MITRKAFLQEAFRQCIQIFESRASCLVSFIDSSLSDQSPEDLNALYREAMHLGIDPASMDGNRLKEVIRERQDESVHGRRVKS